MQWSHHAKHSLEHQFNIWILEQTTIDKMLSRKFGLAHKTHTLHRGQGWLLTRVHGPDPGGNQQIHICWWPGKQSTTKKRGSSKASFQFEAERKEAEADATATPEQEPNNQKTRHVYMTVKLADSFIASNQTGAYPRTSSRGKNYICVFYVFDPNYIKEIQSSQTLQRAAESLQRSAPLVRGQMF